MKLVVINRTELFAAVKLGFVPTNIGSLWCTGVVDDSTTCALVSANISVRPA
jgi:hypothetical protein